MRWVLGRCVLGLARSLQTSHVLMNFPKTVQTVSFLFYLFHKMHQYRCYDPGHLALFFLYFSLFVPLLYSPFFLLDRFPDHVIDYLTSGHLTLSPLLGSLIVRLFQHALLFSSLGRSVTPIVRDLIVVLPLLFVTPIVLSFCTLSQVAALQYISWLVSQSWALSLTQFAIYRILNSCCFQSAISPSSLFLFL